MQRYGALAAVVLCLMAGHVFAQQQKNAAKPGSSAQAPLEVGGRIKMDPAELPPQQESLDPKTIPIIRNILASGAELYYLGEREGLQGFLAYHNGEIQVFYVLPNQKDVVFGAIFSGDGANVTAVQIEDAGNTNAQLKGLLTAAAEQQREIEQSISGTASPKQQGAAATTATPLSPGERLYINFQSAAGQMVGENGKPIVMMLVDPLCPHCRETWNRLKAHVEQGALRVKLLPIGAEGTESEKYAAKFLSAQDALNVWNKFEAGDHSVLSGDPGVEGLKAVRATMAMAATWKIATVPYLVYRSKEGKVKIVQGTPEKIVTVLADLGV